MKKLLGFIIFVLTISCTCGSSLQNNDQKIFEKVYKATVAITADSNLFLIEKTTSSTISSTNVRYSGTGFVVKQNEKSTIILTAAHICRITASSQIQDNFKNYDEKNHFIRATTILTIRDHLGKFHLGETLILHKEFDLCILLSTKIKDVTPLKISNSQPFIGQKIFLSGFPRLVGHDRAGSLIITDGRYSGIFSILNNSMIVSGFAVNGAPGASGSSIINDKGEVVSVMHHIHWATDRVSFGSTLEQTKGIISAYEILMFEEIISFWSLEKEIIDLEPFFIKEQNSDHSLKNLMHDGLILE